MLELPYYLQVCQEQLVDMVLTSRQSRFKKKIQRGEAQL